MAVDVMSLSAFGRASKSMMSRRLQFVLTLCVVVTICSGVSHFAAHQLGIFSDYGVPQDYGPADQKALTILHGSSLAYSGVDWEQISVVTGGRIQSWATAGSSPAEWEVLNRRSPQTNRAFIVVSAYDLNEYWLCDFRADIVPFVQTVQDLWRCGADWQFCKRILSQYPVMVLRKLFPTVGRSDGVLTGIRDVLQEAAFGRSKMETSDNPKFGPANTSETKEKLTDWSPARLQRRLVLMRTTCQGKHSFHGPKKLALTRLLQQASHQGQVVLIVVPVSPIYQKEFLTPIAAQELEETIAEVQHCCPQTRLIRLDQLAALEDNDVFRDLVHLNTKGQQIATPALLEQLEVVSRQ